MRNMLTLFLAGAILTNCGGSETTTLNALNTDTFEASFQAITAEMAQERRNAYVGAILTIANASSIDTVLPEHLAEENAITRFFDPEYRRRILNDLITKAGPELDGEDVDSLVQRAEGIRQTAYQNNIPVVEARIEAVKSSIGEPNFLFFNSTQSRISRLRDLISDGIIDATVQERLYSDVRAIAEGLVAEEEAKVSELETEIEALTLQQNEARSAHEAAVVERERELDLMQQMPLRVSINKLHSPENLYMAKGDFSFRITNETTWTISDAELHVSWSAIDADGDEVSKVLARFTLADRGTVPSEGLAHGEEIGIDFTEIRFTAAAELGSVEALDNVAFLVEVREIVLANGQAIGPPSFLERSNGIGSGMETLETLNNAEYQLARTTSSLELARESAAELRAQLLQ